MTALELYRKHKVGEVSKDRFISEVRKDSQLPWINNMTSYDDAIRILKNKGIIKEDYQASIEDSDISSIIDWVDTNYPEGITPTQLYSKYPGMHDANMYTTLVKLANQGKLVTSKGTKIDSDKVERIMDRTGNQAMMALMRPASANEGRFDVPDPRYIEDPYGGWEFEDDVKDIDHDDDYDAWRDNQERDTDEDDEIKEKKLTKAETEEKEDIVKAMKKTFKGPKSKMYAIATKQAKKSVNEQKDLSLEIDRMNPKIVAKAIDFEMEELPISEMTLSNYFKIQKKVVNKLKKDPKAYDDLFVANSTEMEKSDKKLQMQPVKKDNLNDKPNEMVRVKLKEAIIKLLKEDEAKFDYGLNKSVKLPEGGEGTIVEVKGGTLTVEMADGTKKHYQMNVIRHANNPEQIEKKEEEVKAEPSNHKDELMEKIKRYLQALREKKKGKVDEDETFAVTRTNVNNVKNKIKGNTNLTSKQKETLTKSATPGSTITTG